MRIDTVETNVYKFEELTEEGKESAIEKFRDGLEYPWHGDNTASLKAFCEVFGVDFKDVDYSYGGGNSYITFNMPYNYDNDLDEAMETMTGIRLLKYIINNYWHDINKPTYRGSIDHHTKHKRTKNQTAKHTNNKYSTYYSGIKFDTSCVLTGYCVDDSVLNPVYEFLKKPDNDTTLKSLLDDCFNAWLECCNADYDYNYTDEAVTDSINANEYEFTEDGSIY